MKKPGYRIELFQSSLSPEIYWATAKGRNEVYETGLDIGKKPALADARAFVRWKKGRVIRIEGR